LDWGIGRLRIVDDVDSLKTLGVMEYVYTVFLDKTYIARLTGRLHRKAQLSQGAQRRACSTTASMWLCNSGGRANPCLCIDARLIQTRRQATDWAMDCIVRLDQVVSYQPGNSMLSYL
jgi:hypothetical protein